MLKKKFSAISFIHVSIYLILVSVSYQQSEPQLCNDNFVYSPSSYRCEELTPGGPPGIADTLPKPEVPMAPLLPLFPFGPPLTPRPPDPDVPPPPRPTLPPIETPAPTPPPVETPAPTPAPTLPPEQPAAETPAPTKPVKTTLSDTTAATTTAPPVVTTAATVPTTTTVATTQPAAPTDTTTAPSTAAPEATTAATTTAAPADNTKAPSGDTTVAAAATTKAAGAGATTKAAGGGAEATEAEAGGGEEEAAAEMIMPGFVEGLLFDPPKISTKNWVFNNKGPLSSTQAVNSKGASTSKNAVFSTTRFTTPPVVQGFRSTASSKGKPTPRDVEKIDPKEQATTPKGVVGKFRFPRQVDDGASFSNYASTPPADFPNEIFPPTSFTTADQWSTPNLLNLTVAGPPKDYFFTGFASTFMPAENNLTSTKSSLENLNFFVPTVASNSGNYSSSLSSARPNDLSTTVSTTFASEVLPQNIEEYCLECDDSPPHLGKLCDFNDGAFINACGKCVEGRTGLPANLGLNLCGHCANPRPTDCVGQCFASNATDSMDSCGRCLPTMAENREKCVIITTVFPPLIDRCTTKQQNVVLTLSGAGLNMHSLEGVQCSLMHANVKLANGVLRATPRESSLDVEINVPQQEGRFKINCYEPTNELVSNGFVNVVDSSELPVTGVSPNTFFVGVEIQFNATVPQATANHRLLCALWSRKELITIVPALAEEGSVKCGRIELTVAGRFQLRVVASEYAALAKNKCATSSEIVVKARAPILVSSFISPDLRAIWFDFDQSVEGPTQCDKIFSASSIKVLGRGVVCEYAGARLLAKLGKEPAIQSGGKVQIVVENGIRRAGSLDADVAETLTGVFATVTLHPSAVAVPRYRIIPSNPTCDAPAGASSVAEIRVVPEDGRELNASLRISFNGNESQNQRRNLYLWNTIRNIGDQLLQQHRREGGSNRISINTSLLVPGVEYRITVWAVDMLGTPGEEREVLVQTDLQTTQQPTQLIILGPETTRVDLELRAEAKLVSCDPRAAPPARIKFVWGVMAAGGPLPIKTSQLGRVLRLPPFSMKGGVPHQISCSAYLESDPATPFATGSLVVLTSTVGVESHIPVTSITIGTNQFLEIDGRASRDLDAYPGPLQFSWDCTRESATCVAPRSGAPTSLRTVYEQEMAKEILRLPPGALAVGEHIFSLRVSRASGSPSASSKTQVKVRVVRGASPTIRQQKPLANPVDPTIDTLIRVLLEGLSGRCWAKWRAVVKAAGEVPIELDDQATVSLWEENSNSNRELVLTLKAGKLLPGAAHRLALDAACSQTPDRVAVNRAALEIEIKVATVPTPPAVSVFPKFGEALSTLFTISVESEGATTLTSGLEQPSRLVYEFGFREVGSLKIQPLQTSLYDLTSTTLLHCEGGVSECSVVPVVKVCDAHAVCSSSEAMPVRVSKPAAISQYNLETVALKIDDLLDIRRIGAAYTLARGAIQTARDVPGANQAALILSQRVETSFARTISDMERRLDSGNANAMLKMLDGENFSNQQHEPAPLSTIAIALENLSDRIEAALQTRAPKVMPRRFMGSRQMEPSWPNPRRRKRQDDELENNLTVREVSEMVQQSEEIIFRHGSGGTAQRERALLRRRLDSFLRSLCSEQTLVRSRIVTLSTATLPQVERLRVPLPHNHQIKDEEPAAYVQVSDDDGVDDETCFGVSLITDDFETENASWSFQDMRADTVVRLHTFKETGHAQEVEIDIPLDAPESTDQIWMCARWDTESYDQWLTNECQSLSTQPTRLTCLCPFQSGFYSAVLTVAETANDGELAFHHGEKPTGPPKTNPAPSSTASTQTEQEKLHLDEDDREEFLAQTLFMQNNEKLVHLQHPEKLSTPGTVDSLKAAMIQPQGPPRSEKLSSNLITFTVQSDLLVATQFRPITELEAKIKKQLAQQIRLPENSISECTIERGSISVRISHPKDEVVKRGVMELVRLLKLGRLDLQGFNNDRIRIAPQAVPGYQTEEGGNNNPTGPSGPGFDPGGVPSPSTLPPTTRRAETTPTTTKSTTTEAGISKDAEWVDADVYDENLINADQNMLYGVYAGAGASALILILVIVKSCIDLCTDKPVDWSELPENGQIPGEKTRKPADDTPLYRPIQYPDEIQAALAQVNSAISLPLQQTTGSEYDPDIDSTLPGRPYRVQ
ncbi:uncharacterized protein LOC132196962 isoform X2 [Neocloeon triangulifer]|uniref:uncharacterized protein LOC132196962 isoform X2 n=1 Tax=Neocloeon triangulifer TaxID=2078957 RepID=UPI00286F7275|nr:uncharacterized protein LOC132196962 isoform X2 [Neocloeon triangulifer]